MALELDDARRWCEAMAADLRSQRIDRHGRPYLVRYFVAGWHPAARRPGPAVYLHHFVASDPRDEVHSHPWGWSISLILAGGYLEERCTADGIRAVREFRPGDVNVIEAADRHRIDLLEADCWSLFCAGAYVQPWTFDPSC